MHNLSNNGVPNDYTCDIAIVGGGLSAACVVHGLLGRLTGAATTMPLTITVFEKTANLWTGVPYGELANDDFFLIETLAETNCPLFDSWIKSHPGEVASYVTHSSPVVKEWYAKNKTRIEEGDIASLYFPRRLFGQFVRTAVGELIARAEREGRLNLRWIRQEVINIERRGAEGFLLITEHNAGYWAERAVIATGSIPQRRPCNIPESLMAHPDYISDHQVCACFDLNNRLWRSLDGVDRGRARLVIIGSAASAIETVFFIAESRELKDRIGQITIISTSGRLVGGFYAEDYSEQCLPEYVLLRKSSDIYITAARQLDEEGLLKVLKAKVLGVSRAGGQFELQLEREGRMELCAADIIVNCTGSGSVDNTTSTLINNLKKKLPVNDELRGFNVNTENEVEHHPGLYVVGPLLNRSFSGKQVESIAAVFREGERVAQALAQGLESNQETVNIKSGAL